MAFNNNTISVGNNQDGNQYIHNICEKCRVEVGILVEHALKNFHSLTMTSSELNNNNNIHKIYNTNNNNETTIIDTNTYLKLVKERLNNNNNNSSCSKETNSNFIREDEEYSNHGEEDVYLTDKFHRMEMEDDDINYMPYIS